MNTQGQQIFFVTIFNEDGTQNTVTCTRNEFAKVAWDNTLCERRYTVSNGNEQDNYPQSIMERIVNDGCVDAATMNFGCDAIADLYSMIETIGMGFHPDTPFAAYVTYTGNPTFTTEEVERLSAMLQGCFDELGDDVYSICISLNDLINAAE